MHNKQAHHTWHLRPVGIFFICVFLIALAGYVLFEDIKNNEKNNTNKTLVSVGQLKSKQIQAYLTERKADAAVVSIFLNNPSAQHWLASQGGEVPGTLSQIAESVVDAYQYRGMLLLDSNANIRLVTAHSGMLSEAGRDIALRAMRERTPGILKYILATHPRLTCRCWILLFRS